METYLEKTLDFLKEDKSDNSVDYLKKLFLVYPTLHVDHDVLGDVINETHLHFDIPFHDIKVIGSRHKGFSFVDKNKDGSIKYVTDKSDVDLAIINTELFVKLVTNTLIASKNYTDRSVFPPNKPGMHYFNYYKKSIISGFIRPDTLGCYEDREYFKNFFRELSKDTKLNISAAVYLNETCFFMRLEKQIQGFKQLEEVKNGFK